MRFLPILIAVSALAQVQTYPGQYPQTYPPGQYPQTYPPGSYPPGSYPPNTYPTRLPGGIPVNVPTPEIKLPKKQDKNKPEDAKITVSAVEGSLRKLGEKDLLLEIANHSVLKFRLIAKTQFRNKAGEPMRDSLLHAGDQLSVMVNPEDEETAVRVMLVRQGTAFERAAGEQTVAEAAIRAPRPEDFGKPKTISKDTPSSASASSSPMSVGEDGSSHTASVSASDVSSSVEGTPEARSFSGSSDEEIIRDVRAVSAAYSSGLPNFLANQLTTRYFSAGIPARWQTIDVVTAELAYLNGKEDYRDVKVDGSPAMRPVEQTGAWSTGEFGTTLEDLLAPSTQAAFSRRSDKRVGTRDAMSFDFTVSQANSHWTLASPDGRQYSPAYEGTIYIDKDTRRVLRIEQRTTSIPREYPFSKAEAVLNYAFVKIDSRVYLMPSAGENLGCMHGSGTCTRNAIEFRNYRKFTTEAKVVY